MFYLLTAKVINEANIISSGKYAEGHPKKKKVAKLFGKEAKKGVIREIGEEINRKFKKGETHLIY